MAINAVEHNQYRIPQSTIDSVSAELGKNWAINAIDVSASGRTVRYSLVPKFTAKPSDLNIALKELYAKYGGEFWISGDWYSLQFGLN